MIATEAFRLVVLFALISAICSFPQDYRDDDEDDEVSVYAKHDSDSGKDEKYLTCEEEVHSKYLDGEFVGKVPEYDVYEVLLNFGGPPGEVNTTWVEDTSSKKSGRKFTYDYAGTDYKSWIRTETGRRSNPGSRREKLSVKGTIHWKADNFCGWFRKAEYSLKDGEFTFEVEYGTKCVLGVDEKGEASGNSTFSCSPVPHCTTEPEGCVAGATAGLLAALVGGSG